VALSRNGHLLASGYCDGTMRLWDLKTGGELLKIVDPASLIGAVYLSSSSRTAASGTRVGVIRLWDVMTREQWVTLWGYSGTVCTLAFSSDR
jgi:WD40 repeat protein